MCNLYSITRSQEAIRRAFRVMRDRTGNLPSLSDVFPDTMAPVVRTARNGERELTMMRWGFPPPPNLGTAPVTNVRKQIMAIAKSNEPCRRLMTIPGVGPFFASALTASVGDPEYFSSGRHLAAWLGLVPRQYSTGEGRPVSAGSASGADGYLRKLLMGQRQY